MNLLDIVERLDSFDEYLTIYVETNLESIERSDQNWLPTSIAMLAYEPEDGTIPREAEGMSYFLEVYLAKEIINDFEALNPHTSVTEKCMRLIQFAKYDA